MVLDPQPLHGGFHQYTGHAIDTDHTDSMSGDEIITLACKGNKDAERLCRAWVTRCHELDDCHDRDKPADAERMASAFLALDLELATNPFFQAHRAQLLGLMVQSANAWLDTGKERPDWHSISHDEWNAREAVLKGFYHEVVFHCAFILGEDGNGLHGWRCLRRLTQECREYDFEKPIFEVEPAPGWHMS